MMERALGDALIAALGMIAQLNPGRAAEIAEMIEKLQRQLAVFTPRWDREPRTKRASIIRAVLLDELTRKNKDTLLTDDDYDDLAARLTGVM